MIDTTPSPWEEQVRVAIKTYAEAWLKVSKDPTFHRRDSFDAFLDEEIRRLVGALRAITRGVVPEGWRQHSTDIEDDRIFNEGFNECRRDMLDSLGPSSRKAERSDDVTLDKESTQHGITL